MVAAVTDVPSVVGRAYSNPFPQWMGWIRRTGGHGIWILIWSLVGWAGTAWSPFLLDKPFLLMLLAPRTAFVFLAASKIGLIPFVVLGAARLSMTDASWFVAGRRFPGLSYTPRESGRLRWLRWPLRLTKLLCSWICARPLLAALVLFLRPNGRYLGLAGANAVSSRLAALASVSGTVLYLTAVHQGLGLLLG